MTTKHYPRSDFTPLTEALLQQVWHWRNQSEIRRNMHNDAPISWKQHVNWFSRLKNDNQRKFFVFLQDKRAIGVLNFTHHNDGMLEWGCYLGENNVWPGSGLLLEIAALDYAASQTYIHTLYAEVLSFNHSVLKMHRLFGYQPLNDKPGGTRNNTGYVVNTFQYPLTKWRENRSTILSTLPKQIGFGAQQIHFN